MTLSIPCPCLLAAETMTLPEVLSFLGMGLVVVLGTLSVLALFCVGMGALFQASAKKSKPAAEPTPKPQVASDGLSPELTAVIAAAVAVAIDGSHRIVHIGRSKEDAWALASRMKHHSSHVVRTRKNN